MAFIKLISLAVCVALASSYSLRDRQLAASQSVYNDVYNDGGEYENRQFVAVGGMNQVGAGMQVASAGMRPVGAGMQVASAGMRPVGVGMQFSSPVQHRMAYQPVNVMNRLPVQTVRNVPFLGSTMVARQRNIKALRNLQVRQMANMNVVQNVPVNVVRNVHAVQHVPVTSVQEVPTVQNVPFVQNGYVNSVQKTFVPRMANANVLTPVSVVSSDGY